MYTIFVVSDGSGATAEQVLNAALTQFKGAPVKVERRPRIRTEEEIHQVVREAAETGGSIVHTLVLDELRDEMLRAGRLHNVETIDLMGPLLARLSQQLSISPAEKPGLFRQLNKAYFRRVETMEFALHHDDGQRAHELDHAEIVLVGVSRTFKTPLSIYLAFKGWFVANVPIIFSREPPEKLFDLPPGTVFGLTIDPQRLAQLRQARQERWGTALGEYADPDFVQQEVAYAQAIFARHPDWPVIEVTDKPIEEIATEILVLRGEIEEQRQADPRAQHGS
ncbi:MAG: pyruvate, water dikinase regulatory protein [Chloroflexota bacterium]|nr:pyruvate, water dikinase regulatory protein [Chloroflexota bacterium]